ncbi:MAG: hypothetical protein ACTS9Y_02660 [Methylophilus sp.]|uniref:hypothetical protein n=1 Tax=Methylophilus sp. TaxID=29541 RepID=UPI003FA14C4B
MNKTKRHAHVTTAESPVGQFGQGNMKKALMKNRDIRYGRKKTWIAPGFSSTAS